MKLNSKLFATALAITGSVGLAKADLVVDAFNNTGMAGYDTGPWATTALTATPTPNGLDIAVSGLTGSGNYASAYQGASGGVLNAVADGDVYVRLVFTVVSQANGTSDGNYCGPTVDLIDTSAGGTDVLYNNFYNNYAPGTYTVNALLSSGSGYSLTTMQHIDTFRIGIDSQEDTGYNIIYNGVYLTATPEPATLGLVGMGAAGLLVARRRFAK